MQLWRSFPSVRGEAGASLTLDGREVPRGKGFRVGHRRRAEATDHVAFATVRATSSLRAYPMIEVWDGIGPLRMWVPRQLGYRPRVARLAANYRKFSISTRSLPSRTVLL